MPKDHQKTVRAKKAWRHETVVYVLFVCKYVRYVYFVSGFWISYDLKTQLNLPISLPFMKILRASHKENLC